ncbi:DNA-directed RNA polymerase sigma-70 factor [uncultured Thiomicrorhabdus sp.]
MNHNTQNQQQDYAELYVLGLLSAPERTAFEAKLRDDITLQKQVNDFQNQMLSISDQLPVEPLSQPLGARIERSLDALEQQQRQNIVKQTNKNSIWDSLNLWRGFALAGFFTSILLSVQLLQNTQSVETKTTYIAVLVEPQNKAPGWVIQAGQDNKIELIPLGAVEIPEGKALQFWTKADGWNAPVSLGLVKKGQSLQINIEDLPPLQPNQLFELTLEDENGSATGKPTGPIYSIGRGKPAI